MQFEELRQYKPKILAIVAEHGVGNVRVFGSVARGDADDDSDVDLLITLRPDAGWGYFGFGVAMEELLGCKVDVISEGGLKGAFRERVLTEAKPLL